MGGKRTSSARGLIHCVTLQKECPRHDRRENAMWREQKDDIRAACWCRAWNGSKARLFSANDRTSATHDGPRHPQFDCSVHPAIKGMLRGKQLGRAELRLAEFRGRLALQLCCGIEVRGFLFRPVWPTSSLDAARRWRIELVPLALVAGSYLTTPILLSGFADAHHQFDAGVCCACPYLNRSSKT